MFQQHETLGFVQTKLLLILQGAEARKLLEMAVKVRCGHIDVPGECFNAHGSCVVFPNPGDGLDNLIALSSRSIQLTQKRSLTIFFDGFTWLEQNVMFHTLGLLDNLDAL